MTTWDRPAMEWIEPRPTEPDAPVVRHPDSITHFVCGAAHGGLFDTHFMSGGRCAYCHATRAELTKRYFKKEKR